MTCSSSTTSTPERRARIAVWSALALLAVSTGVGHAASASGEVERYRALAAQQIDAGNMAQAGAALNRALSIAPLDADLWVDIARFRYRGGEHLLAFEAADRALKLGPDDPAALRLKAELVRDRDGMAAALGWFETAMERAPEDLSLELEYAATLGEAGRAADMLAVTREVLEADPGNAQAFYLQAVLAARAGDYGLARRLLDRTEGSLDNLPGALLLRGVVEIDGHNYTLALESLEKLAERQPGNRRVRDLIARALFLSGDYDEVTERFGSEAQGEDASAYLSMTVARAWEQLDRRDRAAPLLDRIAGMPRPGAAPVAGNAPIGHMLAAGDFGSARQTVAGWLAANPGNYDHLALAGDVELAAGNPVGAIRFYDRAARIRSPNSLMARRFQALLLAGDGAGAARHARHWLAVKPASAEALKANAWIAAGEGDWPRAQRLYEVLASSGSQDVQLLSEFAMVQAKTGEGEAAIETAQRAQRLYRGHPMSTQALGVALVAAGERPHSASALLAKARKMVGDNPLLVEARTELAASRPQG